MYLNKPVGVVVPAHNEAQAIGTVVGELRALRVGDVRLVDAIIVCANACTDDTAARAREAGASVVEEPRKGYGHACLRALAELQVELPQAVYIAFIDGDCACDPRDMLALIQVCSEGADLAIGSRTIGRSEAGALPPHQRFGNFLASRLLSRMWNCTVTDLGPLRVITQRMLARLRMREGTYGWTAEMQVKVLALGGRVEERAASSRRRIGRSKVSGTVRGSFGAAWGIFTSIARYARFRS